MSAHMIPFVLGGLNFGEEGLVVLLTTDLGKLRCSWILWMTNFPLVPRAGTLLVPAFVSGQLPPSTPHGPTVPWRSSSSRCVLLIIIGLPLTNR